MASATAAQTMELLRRSAEGGYGISFCRAPTMELLPEDTEGGYGISYCRAPTMELLPEDTEGGYGVNYCGTITANDAAEQQQRDAGLQAEHRARHAARAAARHKSAGPGEHPKLRPDQHRARGTARRVPVNRLPDRHRGEQGGARGQRAGAGRGGSRAGRAVPVRGRGPDYNDGGHFVQIGKNADQQLYVDSNNVVWYGSQRVQSVTQVGNGRGLLDNWADYVANDNIIFGAAAYAVAAVFPGSDPNYIITFVPQDRHARRNGRPDHGRRSDLRETAGPRALSGVFQGAPGAGPRTPQVKVLPQLRQLHRSCNSI